MIATTLATGARLLVDTNPDAARAQLFEALAAHDILGYAAADVLAPMTMMALGAQLGEPDATLRAGALLFRATPPSTLVLAAALEFLAAALTTQ